MDFQPSVNNQRIYPLCTSRPLPTWLGERARRNLAKRDESFRRRIDLIQDFTFKTSSTKVLTSPNGLFIAALGNYPPSVKMFEVRDDFLRAKQTLLLVTTPTQTNNQHQHQLDFSSLSWG